MKLKHLFFYSLIKFFNKKYQRVFNSFYRQKLNSILINLQKKHLQINNIYDIGAYKGEWSNNLSKTSLKNKNFYLFESNYENEKYLKKSNHKYFIETLSDKIKEVKFYSKSHVGDSYYPENTNFYPSEIKPKIITTNTLNAIKKEKHLPLPEFIKVDTQGSEIDILRGGSEILENCQIILLECPIIKYNEGAPSIVQYIDYLNSIEYLPFDISEVHYIDNVLVQVDIIFLKKKLFRSINSRNTILKIFN